MIFQPRPVLSIFLGVAVLLGAGCSTTKETSSGKPYYVKAYRAKNPANVKVKVSIENQTLYVMEGSRPLMVAACSIGRPSTPTPKGNFRIYKKQAKRRRISQPGAGYPMGYWCEFKPAYGIHAGWVHPAPRTAGCIRLHFNAAPKFFNLVPKGAPLNIATRQPEDATIGRNVPRPRDFNDPEFPPHILNTDRIFSVYNGPLYDD